MNGESKEMIETGTEIEAANGELEVVPGYEDFFIPTDEKAFFEKIEKALAVEQKFHLIMLKAANPEIDLKAFGPPGKEVVCTTKDFDFRWAARSGGEIIHPRDRDGNALVLKHILTDSKGKQYYGYSATVRFVRSDKRKFDGNALVTSRDKFFGREYGHQKDEEKIVEKDVRGAAITQATKKAIRMGLGITRFTLKQLEEAGIDTSKIEGYTFRDKSGRSPQGKSFSSSKGSSPGSGKNNLGDHLIDSAKKTEVLGYCQEKKISDSELLKILGSLGYERLPQLKQKDLPKLTKALADLAEDKI